ncbi:MAG: hypothetical protein ACRD5H_12620 [Nitrososphaerales archaeon]
MKKAAVTRKEFDRIVDETSSLLKGKLIPFTKGASLSDEQIARLIDE